MERPQNYIIKHRQGQIQKWKHKTWNSKRGLVHRFYNSNQVLLYSQNLSSFTVSIYFLLPSNSLPPSPRPHLRLDISIVVILEQERSRLGVVLAGCDVQGRQANLPLGVMLQKQGDNRVVTLLESDCKRGEAILE